jgi:aminopeptidase N
MQGPGSIGRTTPHEVAHMWFYSWVGNDQGRDPWIDEGLATWAEARVDRTLSAFVAKPVPPAGRNKAGAPMTYWDANRGAYYRSVYVQTLQALAALGDPDEVDCALRTLVARHGHTVATSAQVISVLSERFPDAPAVLRRYGITA